MKKNILLYLIILGVLLVTLTYCNKTDFTDYTSPPREPSASNTSPRIDKGKDIQLSLPTNYVPINTTVFDKEENIKDIKWEKIAGPDSFKIGKIDMSYSNMNHGEMNILSWLSELKEGIYDFELTVQDMKGLIDRDTIQINISQTNIIGGTELNYYNLQWDSYGWSWEDSYLFIYNTSSMFPAGSNFKVYIKRQGIDWQEVLSYNNSIQSWPYQYEIDNSGNLYVYCYLNHGTFPADSPDIKIVY